MSDAQSYQLVKKLGAGISGVVYLSKNESFAVRQFVSPAPRGSAEWEAGREHFLAGARQATALIHPRIVKVLEVIEEEGEVFVAMENVPAETLGAALSKRPFPPAEANSLLRTLAMTLDFAHQQGVIHGDFKPSNVFLVADCGAKISDFAISPRASRNRGPVSQQWIHPYLSPEHLLDPETICPQSDQYSLAAIAYHFYAGEAPYAGVDAALRTAMTAERTPFSYATGKVLLNALSRNREQRYASCTEFSDALEASLAAPATTVAAVPIAAPRAATHWYVVTGVVLAALLGAAWWATSGHKSSQPPPAAPTTIPAPGPVINPRNEPKPSPKPTVARSTASNPRPKSGSAPPSEARPARTAPAANTMAQNVPPREPQRVAPPAVRPPPRANPPPVRPQPPVPDVPVPAQASGFDIAVLSRTRKIEPGVSFSYRDPVLGELGHGDLRAFVQASGTVPKGKLTLEWVVDGVSMDVKTVAPNQLVEYGNEPTAGQYRVTLKVDAKPVKTFVFRITP
jgi:serine/threonine protein kinase